MKPYAFQLPPRPTRLLVAGEPHDRELRDRLYAGFRNDAITLTVPSVAWSKIWTSSGYDLAAAAGVLAYHYDIPAGDLEDWTIVGEVNLDGSVRGGIVSTGDVSCVIHRLGDLDAILRADTGETAA